MAKTILLFVLDYAAAGLISYVAPRFLIALGMPLDEWIVAAIAAALSLRMSREAAKWGITLALGMALFGAAIFFSPDSTSFQRSVTEVSVNRYRARLNDDVINVVSVPTEIILPTGFPKGKVIIIKDETGKIYPSSPIVVTAENGKIDRLPEIRITANYGSTSFIWDGQRWSMY
jgi:hypothetical protein